ncbi:mobile element protein [Aquipluma nitroreducens]|uniref:Mobile element protein n=1 Tax=Aquipluma nitroreducens TaxID=2010828 RepID=A0A5K7SBL9_9BACT|nr:IS4 family transposase [Aquipluma nitroreducens]BBE16625.1 mobile element protein [Aquipluma nitroreducens]BBE18885.1 mobile element protein [Aquipluma nitroreducens]
MNQGKYIFAQLTDFLPLRVFDRIVENHQGNKYVRHFTCWNQMLCMVFGQLTSRDSMRDLMLSLEAHQSKYYHLGLGSTITRRNLGKANEKRSYKIFEEFAYVLIEEARRSCYKDEFEIDVDGNIFALDSTTIDLCLSVFWWAEFRKHKGGIKLHTIYDVKTSIPSFLHITTASVHDVNILDLIPYETGSFYIVDKGYIDFKRLYRLHLKGAFFVTRAKDNMRFKRMYSSAVDKTTGVLYDQIGRLETYYSRKDYPEKLRRIKYYDQNRDRTFIFMTNNTDLKAEEIAMLYKKRWEVELFFKWMKQHLRIKSFWGTTMNAVKVQIYCAIIAYCLIAIVGNKLKVDRSIYEILQILSISLLDKAPVREILTKCDYKNVKELNYKQLTISGF